MIFGSTALPQKQLLRWSVYYLRLQSMPKITSMDTCHLSGLGASHTSGLRTFPGFQVYRLGDYMSSFKLSDKCNTALTATIECDTFIQSWQQPAWRGGLGNSTLTDCVCDAGCGASLTSYFTNVQTSCVVYNLSGYPLTIPGGYIWEGL